MVRGVRAHLDSYDHDLAREMARGLERVLAEHVSLLPNASRKEAFELLIDVEIIEFKRLRQEGAPSASTARAREFLTAAKDVTGDTDGADAGLVATEAYLDSLEQGAEVGLARLEGRDNPQAMRRRLSILLEHERFSEADSVVRDHTPERAWCEKAVAAFAWVGEIARAKEAIRWAGRQDDPALRRRSILCYAESRLAAAFRNRGKDRPIIPGSLDETRALSRRGRPADAHADPAGGPGKRAHRRCPGRARCAAGPPLAVLPDEPSRDRGARRSTRDSPAGSPGPRRVRTRRQPPYRCRPAAQTAGRAPGLVRSREDGTPHGVEGPGQDCGGVRRGPQDRRQHPPERATAVTFLYPACACPGDWRGGDEEGGAACSRIARAGSGLSEALPGGSVPRL